MRFPAYQLGLNPSLEVISASASHPLAEEFGAEVRNCVKSPEYQYLFPDVELREDSAAKGKWVTTAGGGYRAVGIGGDLYGRGGHLGIIDDPFGSWEDAQSETSRKRVWNWYTGTFYNRIRPGGAIVVIQHRLHEDDLVGLLMEHEQHGADKWKVVKIPADFANPPWAERYDAEALKRLEKNSFPRVWSSMYLQDPSPEEGEYFKREWMHRYNIAPAQLNYYVTGDFAVTDDGGDFTDLGVWGMDNKGDSYLVDAWWGQKTSDVWVDKVLDLVDFWHPFAFVAEGGQIRRAVEPWLEKRMLERGVFVAPTWLPTTAEKPAMARSFQGMCHLGRVFFPNNDKGDHVIDQLLRFPGSARNDAVDQCSLYGRYIAKTWKATVPEVPKDIEWDAPLTMGQMMSVDDD
jgi:hypothetical protein